MNIIGIIVLISLFGGLFVLAPLWLYFLSKSINKKIDNLENIKTQIKTNQEKLNQKIAELTNNKILSPQEKIKLQTEINTIQAELTHQQADLSQIQFSLGRLKLKKFTKTNPKKPIIIYYILMISIVAVFSGVIFLIEKQSNNPKIYPIPDTTTEVKEEYFEGYQIHDSNKISKKHPIPSNEKPYLGADGKTWYLYKNSAETLQGTPMIEITYTFHGLNGLGKGQHQADEPTDLAPFMKNPFNNWYINLPTFTNTTDYFLTFGGTFDYAESQFGLVLCKNYGNHIINIKYKGPKWLIEEDKDFYIDGVRCHINDPNDRRFPKKDMKTYYLHFNPVKQYLTLYTKKFNTK